MSIATLYTKKTYTLIKKEASITPVPINPERVLDK